MVFLSVTCRKQHYARSDFSLVPWQIQQKSLFHPPLSFSSVLSMRPHPYVASVIDSWMKLDLWKKDEHSGRCTACMPFAQRGTHWDISSVWAFSKGACAAVPAKGSTVGQQPIELQPLLCGGVEQIRPHNCLPSQTGTAASPHPPEPATDCCSFGEPSVRNKSARWSNDCSAVLPLSLLWGGYEWPLNWINMSSVHYVTQLPCWTVALMRPG